MKNFAKVLVVSVMPAFMAGALGAELVTPTTQPAIPPAAATQAAAPAATAPAGSLVIPDGTSLENPGPSMMPLRLSGVNGYRG